MIETALSSLSDGHDLSMDEMTATMGAVIEGLCSESEISQLLTALRAKGETVAEVTGAALAMRRHMTPIRHKRQGVIDTCGPGGVGSCTFNISTAAALVTAASGIPVAKHGNRSVTSKSGSADVLAALGVNIEANVATVERCLDELGICFCFAPILHGSMRHVAPVRRKLGVATIFNLLGPLTNPAGAEFQLVGTGNAALRLMMAQSLSVLGSRHALVVSGDDGLAEVSLSGPTRVTEVLNGQLRDFTWRPSDFGLTRAPLDALRIDTPEQSAAMIRSILDGEPGPGRDIVVLNAAAALFTSQESASPLDCAGRAAKAIDSGAAKQLLAALGKLSHGQ